MTACLATATRRRSERCGPTDEDDSRAEDDAESGGALGRADTEVPGSRAESPRHDDGGAFPAARDRRLGAADPRPARVGSELAPEFGGGTDGGGGGGGRAGGSDRRAHLESGWRRHGVDLAEVNNGNRITLGLWKACHVSPTDVVLAPTGTTRSRTLSSLISLDDQSTPVVFIRSYGYKTVLVEPMSPYVELYP